MAERSALTPMLLWSSLFVLAAALTLSRLLATPAANLPDMADLERVILFHSTLPRFAVSLVAGASLGLSGHLLQRVLRNPLAEPTTLGIASGAQLALALATLYLPTAMAVSREGVALVGGALAVSLLLVLTWRRGLEPVSVVLAGMMISLTASAASATLILANGEYMFSLFIWGGGSLVQQGWDATIAIAIRFAIVGVAAMLLLRPLTIVSLDDASARSLGVALHTTRLAVIALAVWLATTVTAYVGVIGFVGLAAPALARLSGARTPSRTVIASILIGALLLWLTDSVVQFFASGGGERIPTGAATALLGGPMLLWLLPRLRMFARPSIGRARAVHRTQQPARTVAMLAAAAFLAALFALAVGRDPQGWTVSTGPLLLDLAHWRGPRVVVAAASGAMLAAAGVILQRLTANPLASPEILGIGSGAGVGLAAALFLFTAPGLIVQFGFSLLGAGVVLVAMLALSAGAGFGRERLLLAGVAMNALCSAVLTSIIAMGNVQSFELLRWLSGSVNDVTWANALFALCAALVLICPLPVIRRWLELMPLGDVSASALGLAVDRTRLALVAVAAMLTTAATLLAGPLSFVGLVAPHLARLMGLTGGMTQLAGAIFGGAALMTAADFLSRMVLFPYQAPLGLFAMLLAGPYLVWLLGRGDRRRG